ncbi:MAG: tetratricopeptide repeat protein [Elusimicrobia bacterium]|nr:tetratricopeptide repeat protein [Elusimicrobiota bacterium]
MRSAVLGGLLAVAGPAWAGETVDTYRGAWAAFLAGQAAQAEAGYKYLVTLGVDGAKPTANLAVVARDGGRADEALAHWLRATLIAPYDAALWSQRGWGHLAIGRYKDAREAFLKAVEVSSAPHQAAEASFGLGLTEQYDGNAKAAIAAYQRAFTRSPYLLPAVAAQLGRLAVHLKKWPTAETYLKQSLEQDPQQPDLFLELARVFERMGTIKGAWQAYKIVLDMDPSQQEARERMDKLAKNLSERPERLLPVRRLGRPLLTRFEEPPPSVPLRVGLFSDASGSSAHATRLFFLSGSEFRVSDVRLGEVTRGAALDQWEALWRPDTRVIELRDPQKNLKFTTKQAFRIEPLQRGGSVLVKSVAFNDVKGVDIGDRELRGVVEVVPTPDGFAFVNEVAVDDYVASLVSGSMPSGSPREALRAQAVIARSRAWAVAKGAHHSFLNSDLCDSSHCEVYNGLVQESSAAREAVTSTAGGRLFKNGAPLVAAQHRSCGWATEDRGEDRNPYAEGPARAGVPASLVESAYDLEALARSYPPPGLFCEASSLSPASWSRWVRVLDSDALRARIERTRFIGRLHDVRVAARSRTGRVTALDVVGSRETLRVEGTEAIGAFLAPGSLRSTLFTLQPLYRGRTLRQLIVWGAGTGDGRGLCIAGALGQAHLGRKYRQILAHYLPGSEVRGAPVDPEEAAVYRAATGGVTPREQSRARGKRAARIRQAQRERSAKRRASRAASPPRKSTAPAPSPPPGGDAER